MTPPALPLTPRERALVARLRTPAAVQAWLNAMPYNDEVGGETLVIRHVVGRGPTRREGGLLLVAGDADYIRRRVRDWLKTQARAVLAERSRALAATIGKTIASIRLSDPRSRWGSCSSEGGLEIGRAHV